MLVILYLIPKLAGKLLNLDKNSNVKGDNHTALLLILLVAPSVFGIGIFLGLLMVVVFSVLSWMDERGAKSR